MFPGGLSYLIQLIELEPLFLRAAASNRANVQHPVTEFNKRPPAEERKNHQDCKLDQNTHTSGWWWLWGTSSWAAWCWPCSSDRSWWKTEAVLLPYDSEWTEKADKLNLQPSMSFQDTRNRNIKQLQHSDLVTEVFGHRIQVRRTVFVYRDRNLRCILPVHQATAHSCRQQAHSQQTRSRNSGLLHTSRQTQTGDVLQDQWCSKDGLKFHHCFQFKKKMSNTIIKSFFPAQKMFLLISAVIILDLPLQHNGENLYYWYLSKYSWSHIFDSIADYWNYWIKTYGGFHSLVNNLWFCVSKKVMSKNECYLEQANVFLLPNQLQ